MNSNHAEGAASPNEIASLGDYDEVGDFMLKAAALSGQAEQLLDWTEDSDERRFVRATDNLPPDIKRDVEQLVLHVSQARALYTRMVRLEVGADSAS